MSPLTLAHHRHGIMIEGLADRAKPIAHSDHFALWTLRAPEVSDPDDIVVVHDFSPEQIDNNIGGYVADELLPLLTRSCHSRAANEYAYNEHETFERYVGSIVRSIDGNERRAWHRFYDNTLAALSNPHATTNGNGVTDFNASFRALYAKVAELVAATDATSLLDVATCFGFLPLHLATRLAATNDAVHLSRITGCDLNPALVALADDYRKQRRLAGIRFVCADILATDVCHDLANDGSSFDVVTAIHLLEHLEPDETATAVAALWSLTAKRMIIAVPFESVADRRFGHRQVFDAERLQALGGSLDGRSQYFECNGGWLVVDVTETRR